MILTNIFNKFNGKVCIICNYQFGGNIKPSVRKIYIIPFIFKFDIIEANIFQF